MAYPSCIEKAASVSGVAEISGLNISSGTAQISCIPTSGSSIVTLTVKPILVDTYQDLEGGTIDLSAPTTLWVNGYIDSIKAVAANSSDTFTLSVVG